MAHLIDKSALVAEIKRRKRTWQHQDQQYVNGGKDVCDYLLGFLDTLEVKEVDLENEIILWANAIPEIRLDDVERLAKHFYELGLKTKGE